MHLKREIVHLKNIQSGEYVITQILQFKTYNFPGKSLRTIVPNTATLYIHILYIQIMLIFVGYGASKKFLLHTYINVSALHRM